MPKDMMGAMMDAEEYPEDEPSEEARDEFTKYAKDAGFTGDKASALKMAIQACLDDNAYSAEEPMMEEESFE